VFEGLESLVRVPLL
jgi:transposase